MDVKFLFYIKELINNDHFNKGEILIKHSWGKSMWKDEFYRQA
jgi:hypothetical protein